jgi:dUTP pyrophosphatase
MKIKLLNNLAKVPTRGSKEAAGFDLYAATDYDITIPAHCTVKIGTGIAAEIPSGYFGMLVPRSGIATKRGLRPANSPGTIDSDYRGEIIVALHNDSADLQTIEAGERIAQLIIVPYAAPQLDVVTDLDETDRGTNGFGSTGKH